jgi:phage-related protein
VSDERPLAIVFFRSDAGNEPVREWLQDLNRDERKVIGSDILAVQYAWPIGKPLVDHLDASIWEVRSKLRDRIARVLFSVVEQEIVLLHGFIKKTQATTKRDLALAKSRFRKYRTYYEK